MIMIEQDTFMQQQLNFFFESKPWDVFNAKETFVVSNLGSGVRLFFMAASGEAGGITLGQETDPHELMSLLKNGERANIGENDYHRCLAFSEEENVAFEDLNAIERYNWKIPNSKSNTHSIPFPFAFLHDAGEGLFRPTRADLDWFEVALRAITAFTETWKKKGKLDDDYKFELLTTIYKTDVRAQVRYYGLKLDKLEADWKDLVAYASKQPGSDYPTTDLTACRICGKPPTATEPLKRCGSCKLLLYCTKECQAKDWSIHKTHCKKV